MLPQRIAVVLLLASVAVSAQAGVSRWSSQGPEGGHVNALVVDPRNPQTAYAATDGGVWKSTNGGDSWDAINTGLVSTVAEALAIDAANPSILYVGTSNGVYKSTDGGLHWIVSGSLGWVLSVAIAPSSPQILYAGSLSSGPLYMSTDGGTSWAAIDAGTVAITAIAIHPQDPSVVYLSDYLDGIWQSVDGGAHWSLSLGESLLERVIIDPLNPTRVYAADPFGVFRSVDSGSQWTLMHGMPGQPTDLAVDPVTPLTLYAGGTGGVARSVDGGDHWTPLNAGLTFRNVLALTLAPSDPTRLYAGTGAGGVFRSSDAGMQWQPARGAMVATEIMSLVFDPANRRTALLGMYEGGVWKSTDGGSSWALSAAGIEERSVWSLAIDPTKPSMIFAGSDDTVYRSVDGGETWNAAGGRLPTTFPVHDLAIDPANPSTIFAGADPVYKSTDGGMTWHSAGALGQVFGLAIDPKTPATVYAASTLGLYRSTDGGASWSVIKSGSFAAVKVGSGDPTVLYALDLYHGLFKSSDGAATWEDAASGLPQDRATAAYQDLALDPRRPSSLTVCGPSVYHSLDGGANWRQFDVGLTTHGVQRLAVDAEGDRLLAGTANGVFSFEAAPRTRVVAPRGSGAGAVLPTARTFRAGAVVSDAGGEPPSVSDDRPPDPP